MCYASDTNSSDIETAIDSDTISETEIASIDDSEILKDDEAGTFSDLQNLIDGVSSGGNLTLTKNYTYNTDFSDTTGIVIDKEILIDGGGYTLNGCDASRIFNIIASSVTLKNIKFINGIYEGNGGALYIYGDNVTITNCVFDGNGGTASDSHGGAVWWSGNYASLTGSNFTGNYVLSTDDNSGGALHYQGSYFNFTDCEFISNNCNNSICDGGAVNLFNGAYNGIISDCLFKNNRANDFAGAVVYSGSNTTFEKCRFENNYARTSAGALYLAGADNYIKNCTFKNNTAQSNDAGAVFLESSRNSVENSAFINNTASYSGAAIYIFWWGSYGTSIKGCTFENNTSNTGTVCISNDNCLIDNCTFNNNYARWDGGAVKVEACNNIIINNTQFNSNRAGNQGGALFIWRNDAGGENITVNNCTFKNNIEDSGSGGAICTYGLNNNITNCVFINNTGKWGGAIGFERGNTTVSDCKFLNNTATTSGGGAIYCVYENVEITGCEFSGNTAPSDNNIYSTVDITVSDSTVYSTLTLSAESIMYGSNAIITGDFSSSIDGSVFTLYCSLEDSSNLTALGNVTVMDNSFEYTWIKPAAGNYTLTLNSTDLTGNNYVLNFTPIDIAVYKADADISVIYNETVKIDEYINVTVKISENATGNVTLTIDNETFTFVLNNNTGSLILNNYPAGVYAATVSYSGDNNFTACDVNLTLTFANYNATDLKKVIEEAIANGTYEVNLTHDYVFEDDELVPVTLNSTVKINGNGHTVDANGLTGIFNITGDNVILTNMTLTGTNGTAVSSNASNTTISDIEITDTNGTAININGDNANINGLTLTNVNGTGVNVTGDNAAISAVTLNNHTGTGISTNGSNNTADNIIANGGEGTVINATGFNASISNVTANYHYGDVVNAPEDANVGNVTVNKYNTIINAENASYIINYGGTYTVNINTGLSGKTLTFTINSKTYTAEVDENGTASITLTKAMLESAGAKIITVEFGGDDAYTSASVNATITVNKENVKITAKSVKKTYKKSKTKKIKITLKNSKNKVLTGKFKITLKVNKKLKGKVGKKLKKGKVFSVKFNKKGIGVIKLTNKKVKFNKRTYKFTATVKATSIYKSAVKKNIKMKIK